MTTTTDELIQRLLALNTVDLRIRELTERLERAPAAVSEREEAAKGLEDKASQVRQKLALLRAQRRMRENEVRGLDAKLERLKSQSSNVRSNKDFVAFRSEISNTQAESDRLQGEVLKILEVEEQADARIKQLEEQRDAERARAASMKEQTLEQMGAVRAEREALQNDRKKKVEDLPKEALQLYDRCRVARGAEGQREVRRIAHQPLQIGADLAAQIAELLGCDETGLRQSPHGSTRAAPPPRAGRPRGRV